MQSFQAMKVLKNTYSCLVPVRVRLVRPVNGNIDVVRLLLRELRECRSECGQVEAGHFLVQALGEKGHLSGSVLAGVALLVASGRDEDVNLLNDLINRDNLVTL